MSVVALARMEKLHEFQFSKWVGIADAIGWRVGSFFCRKIFQSM